MMSFFSSPFAVPAETSFTPLFRLLDDFESYQQQLQDSQQQNNNTGVAQQRRQSPPARTLPTFKPRFDVRETEHTYVLHGELAGLERENVEIEFTEPQTMVIRGRVERAYEKKPELQQQPEAAAEVAEEKNQKRRNSHQATVEDDPEEPSTPVHTPPESPKTKPADKQQQQQVQKPQKFKAPATQQPRYWVYERSVGEFWRAFSFPTRVEHDGVSASLDNGILTVTVPKAKKHEVRRIAIN